MRLTELKGDYDNPVFCPEGCGYQVPSYRGPQDSDQHNCLEELRKNIMQEVKDYIAEMSRDSMEE